MVFSSMTFLMAFLPVCLILYYLTPNKGRNLVLFLCVGRAGLCRFDAVFDGAGLYMRSHDRKIPWEESFEALPFLIGHREPRNACNFQIQ